MQAKRLLIVGGVAGGASCAARARRLSESAEIIIFERGPFVSFANCGLPYYVGEVIKKEDDLLVATPERFKKWFNIDVRTGYNVRRIIPIRKTIEVENSATGDIREERYDTLVLSPGALPLKPKIEGIDLPGIFTLRTIPDTRQIKAWLAQRKVEHAAIVGGGFIGLEMAENLQKRGVRITVIEMLPQVMPPIDYEMAAMVHDHLREKKVELCLGSPVVGFSPADGGAVTINTAAGRKITADMALLALGVRPETELARDAGLEIGETGGILVDEYMRTSQADIYAVGDAVQVKDFVTQTPALIPLAGPANRQGRLAADVIMAGQKLPRPFRGVQGTAVCGVCGLTIAVTGATEKRLEKLKQDGTEIPYEKLHIWANHHVSYYPDAQTLALKLIFSPQDGKVLGAQAIGLAGVEKRIDVIAMAIQKGATVYDLAECELCYAPQYGAAKDPVNLVGMAAANLLEGLSPTRYWEDLAEAGALVLDVRDLDEYKEGHVKDALHIPLGDLRERLAEVPPDREIWAHCLAGVRSYYAIRILTQRGYTARNISGGYALYNAVKQFKDLP